MKKIAVLLVAAMLALTLVGCADVTKVSLTDEALKSKGPDLKELVGTWNFTKPATYITKTVATYVDDEAANYVRSKIVTSNFNYSLVVAKPATKDAPYTYTYTMTEVLVDPGMLVSNVTTSADSTVITYYSEIDGDGNAGSLFNDYFYSDEAEAGDRQVGSEDNGAAEWDLETGYEIYGDWVFEDTTATAPKAVAIAGTTYTYTVTGTITESENFNSVIGRTVPSYIFADTTASSVTMTVDVDADAPASPVFVYNTSTNQISLGVNEFDSEYYFTYLPEAKTWSFEFGGNELVLADE